MQRQWTVRPDETGTVSQGALAEAVMDGVVALDRMGGSLNVIVQRTGNEEFPWLLDNEKVTTFAIVDWRNDVNAKPQPESTAKIVPDPEPEEEPELAAVPDPAEEPVLEPEAA